ncbi:acyl-homoserine-lactone synthase [Hyphomicrobium sp.]|uniref:N-acyl amino acid synthase FeeM domain-containing protein n=1 Tax=Hyphomicrobium sp. TaxID=82 RepID=UPI000FBC2CCC|nr:acyl-homoserine-lactone synthase [Hyphomicrobium sp.]RUP08326.1 MAG: autoinducer synthase [Hyphomicrobium sp.]
MSIPLSFRPRQDTLPPDEGSWHGETQSFELRVLAKEIDVNEATALRLRAYQAIGYDVSSDNGKYTDRFDSLATTVLLGAYDQGRLVGSVRLCFNHPWQTISSLPCGPYYPALKEIKSKVDGALVEVSRLSIEPGINNTSYRTTLYAFLVRAALTAAQAAEVSMLLIATRPEWVKFYKYMLGFQPIGEPAFYPPGDFKITLLGGSLKLAETRQKLQNRFFKITPDEVASMRVAIQPALVAAAVSDGNSKVAAQA